MDFSASVFGELWRLEPLPEERKSKWRTEMDWLLTPTKYMVELVPSKRIGANGQTMEVLITCFWFIESQIKQLRICVQQDLPSTLSSNFVLVIYIFNF